MKFYLKNSYEEIPQFAEVEMIGFVRRLGFPTFEVKYQGKTYYPDENLVISEETIKYQLNYFREQFLLWENFYNKIN